MDSDTKDFSPQIVIYRDHLIQFPKLFQNSSKFAEKLSSKLPRKFA